MRFDPAAHLRVDQAIYSRPRKVASAEEGAMRALAIASNTNMITAEHVEENRILYEAVDAATTVEELKGILYELIRSRR